MHTYLDQEIEDEEEIIPNEKLVEEVEVKQ